MNTPQEKITEARQRGDLYEQNVLGGELQKLMKDKNVSPLKAIYPILMQASDWTSLSVSVSHHLIINCRKR